MSFLKQQNKKNTLRLV